MKWLDNEVRKWIIKDGLELCQKDPAKFLQMVITSWIEPEGKKRGTDLGSLEAAQVIINLSKAEDEVRLNGEVVDTAQLSQDTAHITLRKVEQEWLIELDLEFNAQKIQKNFVRAGQFLDTAKYAFSQGHLHACIDNLFAAMELLSRAYILMQPERLKIESHGSQQSLSLLSSPAKNTTRLLLGLKSYVVAQDIPIRCWRPQKLARRPLSVLSKTCMT